MAKRAISGITNSKMKFKIYYMKQILFLLSFFILTNKAFTQTKEDEAQAYYQKAEEAYENKQNKECDAYLTKAANLLGSQNPKLLYLSIKNESDGIRNGVFPSTLYSYQLLEGELDYFFKLVDKNTYPTEKYTEMVGLKLDVSEKVQEGERRKAIYLGLKNRETAFIRDTIDVYMAAFCNDYNEAFKNHPHINKTAINNTWGCSSRLEYNASIHSIKKYEDKSLKYAHYINVLEGSFNVKYYNYGSNSGTIEFTNHGERFSGQNGENEDNEINFLQTGGTNP